MKREAFRRLIDTVYGAADEEISCSEYFATLPRYVDLERAGKDAKGLLPGVGHHIRQCPECGEVYHALRGIGGA